MSDIPAHGTDLYASFANHPPSDSAHRAFVILARLPSFIAEFIERVPCVPGEVADMQFIEEHSRWTARAKVEAMLCGGLHPVVHFALLTEPALVERRSCIRVSTAAMSLRALVNQIESSVLNICAEGMAVIIAAQHHLNDRVRIALVVEGEVCSGDGRVVNLVQRHDGRWRCGLHFDAGERPLLHGLERLVATHQREQLQRLASRASRA